MFERIWVFLHVVTMFSAVAVSIVPELLMHRMAANGDVRGIRAFGTVYKRFADSIALFYIGGAILGLLAVFFDKLDFLAPWLLIAYVLFIVAMVLGAAIQGPWGGKLIGAAMASPADQPSAEFQAVAHDQRAKYAMYAALIIIVVIIFDMVVKPFSPG